ncbi:MAG: HD domain-containing phosphohydrolase [Rhodocyclaceae bacterium]
MSVPQGLNQLHRILASRIILAALLLGALAGVAAYLVESRRIEASAMASVAAAVRHFQAPAMQILGEGKRNGEHREIDEILRMSSLVGLRVFDPSGKTAYETWSEVSESTKALLQTQPKSAESSPSDQHERLELGADKLIRLQVRLADPQGRQAGRLEGFYLIGADTLDEWRARIAGTVTMAVVAVLATAAVLYPLLQGLLHHATGLTSRLMASNLSLLTALGSAIAKRDSDTDAHNYRVTLYAVALAEAMRMPDEEIAHLIVGAFLHDVGKIGIPDAILLKPGRLSTDEFEIMKTHTSHGLDIVSGNAWLERAASVIRHHHEKFDGSGYPDGLARERIPQIARVFAIVDVFDALVSARPYKLPMSLETALAIISDEAGKHFDPAMVAAFEPIAGLLQADLAMANDAELRRRLDAAIAEYF